MRRAIPVLVALLVLGPVLGLGPGNTRAAAPPMIVLVLVDDMRATDYQALPQTRKLLAEGGDDLPQLLPDHPHLLPVHDRAS